MPTTTPAMAPRRVDGSMSLLVDMMANTLDEAYAERAAAVRDPTPTTVFSPGKARRRGLASVAGLLALGILTGTAVAQVRARQDAGSGLRAGLAQEVRVRTAESDVLSGRAQILRDEVAATRQTVLGANGAGRAVAERLIVLGFASATSPVRGPGVVVTLDDAPTALAPDPTRSVTVDAGRVTDRDLQDTANALWAAGAEAISINGQRLTVLTAKRSAGESILVDLLGLVPPYAVQAIGDGAALELGLLDGPVGRRLTTYTERYGLRLDVRRADDLRLPGAADPELRSARRGGNS